MSFRRPNEMNSAPIASGSKITSMTSAEMHDVHSRGESCTDWERVRRKADQDTEAAMENRAIGEAIGRKRDWPVGR